MFAAAGRQKMRQQQRVLREGMNNYKQVTRARAPA